MTDQEKKKSVLRLVGEAIDNNNSLITIGRGKQQSVIYLQGKPVNIIRALAEAMLKDAKLFALVKISAEFAESERKRKRITLKEDKFEKPDCENCESRDNCEVKGEFDKEIVADLLRDDDIDNLLDILLKKYSAGHSGRADC